MQFAVKQNRHLEKKMAVVAVGVLKPKAVDFEVE
jgi:hypothetical protein